MDWGANQRLREDLRVLAEVIADLRIKIPKGSRVAEQLTAVTDYLDNRPRLMVPDTSSNFFRWYYAMTTAMRLTRSVAKLRSQPRRVLRRTLNTVFAEKVEQDFQTSQAKDLIYELQVAA